MEETTYNLVLSNYIDRVISEINGKVVDTEPTTLCHLILKQSNTIVIREVYDDLKNETFFIHMNSETGFIPVWYRDKVQDIHLWKEVLERVIDIFSEERADFFPGLNNIDCSEGFQLSWANLIFTFQFTTDYIIINFTQVDHEI